MPHVGIADAAESIKTHSLTAWRFRVWQAFDEPSSGRVAKLISAIVFTTIGVSIVTMSIGSYPDDLCGWTDGSGVGSTGYGKMRECSATSLEDAHPIFAQLETICIMIFTVEFVARLLTCSTVMPMYKFFLDPMTILDLVAIAPWYITSILEFINNSGGSDIGGIFKVVRIIRLVRVLRILKVSKSMKMMLVLFRTLHRSLETLGLLFFLLIVMMLLFGAFVIVFEGGEYNAHLRQYISYQSYNGVAPSQYGGDVFDAMYWVMATMSTVGYGDLFPYSAVGQFVGISTVLMGLVILSLPITLIATHFSEEYLEQQRIADKERRLKEHNAKLEEHKLKMQQQADEAEEIRNSAAGTLFAKMKKRANSSKLPGSGKMRLKSTTNVMRMAGSLSGQSMRSFAQPKAKPVPGYVEAEWLLEEYRQASISEVRMTMQKAEGDLMRMARKCIIHSRMFAQTDRAGEAGPGGVATLTRQESRWDENESSQSQVANRRVRRLS